MNITDEVKLQLKCVNTNITFMETLKELYQIKYMNYNDGMLEMLELALDMNIQLKKFYQQKFN